MSFWARNGTSTDNIDAFLFNEADKTVNEEQKRDVVTIKTVLFKQKRFKVEQKTALFSKKRFNEEQKSADDND